jgi:predicted DNA binding CopG/RHH family protein
MKKKLSEEEFEKQFDAGADPESLGFDMKNAVVDNPEIKRVNLDIPEHFLGQLDRHASAMGITRQSLIKVWLFERLKAEASGSAVKS